MKKSLYLILFQEYCNDCDALVQEALALRGLNPHESTVLVGLDDGQGIVNIRTTIQGNRTTTDISDKDETDRKRSQYSEVSGPLA